MCVRGCIYVFCLLVCMCIMCMYAGQKRVQYPSELELWMVASCPVALGNGICIFTRAASALDC